MKAPIPGVAPPDGPETTVMWKWPSIAAFPWGRRLGRWYAIGWPDWGPLRLGRLIALASIPVALALYFYRLAPSLGGPRHGWWCKLTNRRLLKVRNEIRKTDAGRWPRRRFAYAAPYEGIGLDQFDEVRIEPREGQAWFHAADLVLLRDGHEVFRLPGIARPEAFRQTLLKTRQALVAVRNAAASASSGA